MLGRHADAEDAAQEAVLRAWRFLPDEGFGERGWRPWLVTIARREALRQHERRERTTTVDPDDLGAEAAPTRSPDRFATLALRELSPDDRTVIYLRYVQDLAYDEIADRLAITPGAVRLRAHRARTRLRKRLVA